MHMCTNHADAQDARAHGHVHVICGHHGRHDEVVSESTTRAPSHHCRYAFNNPMVAFFCGTGYGDGPFGVTLEEQVRTR